MSELELPFPWERHFSEDDGSFYFYNPETGECFWQEDVERAIEEDEEQYGEHEYNDQYEEQDINNQYEEQGYDDQYEEQVDGQYQNLYKEYEGDQFYQYQEDQEQYQEGQNNYMTEEEREKLLSMSLENLSEEEILQLYQQFEDISLDQYQHNSTEISDQRFIQNNDLTTTDQNHLNDLFQQEQQLLNMHQYLQSNHNEEISSSIKEIDESLTSLAYNMDSNQNNSPSQPAYTPSSPPKTSQNISTKESPKPLTDMNVLERTQLHLINKDKKINQIKKEREEKSRDGFVGYPQINKKSQVMNRSINDMLQWEEERKKKLQMKAQQYEEDLKEKITGHPKVTKLAQNLAKKRELNEFEENEGEYDLQSLAEGTVHTSMTNHTTATSQSTLHQRLMEYEEKKKQKIQQKIKSLEKEAKDNSKPNLNPMTRKIIQQQRAQQQLLYDYYQDTSLNEDLISLAEASLGSSASDRLYALSKLREKSNYEVQNKFLSGGKLLQHDEKTGQRLFEPRINPTSRALASKARDSNLPVEDQLRIKGLIYQRKIMERERKAELQEKSLRESRRLNSVSEKIVMERMMAYGETSKDRLNKPIGSLKDRTVKSLTEESPSFKPQISQGSKEILSQLGNRYRYCPTSQGEDRPDDSFLLMQDWDILSNAPQDGQPICVDDIRGKKNNNSLHVENPNNIYERTNYWQSAREKKLQHEREERQKELMKECSFKPKTSSKSAKIVTKGLISDRHNQWAKEKEERMERERRKKLEEEERHLTFTPTVLPSPNFKTNNLPQSNPHSTVNLSKPYESLPTPPPPPSIVTHSINSLKMSSSISNPSINSSNLKSYNTQQITNPKEYSLYSEEKSRQDLYPPPPPPPLEEEDPPVSQPYQFSSQIKRIPLPKKVSLSQVQENTQDVSQIQQQTQSQSQVMNSMWSLQDPDDQHSTRSIPQFSNGSLIKSTPYLAPNNPGSFSQSDFEYSRFKDNFTSTKISVPHQYQKNNEMNIPNPGRIPLPISSTSSYSTNYTGEVPNSNITNHNQVNYPPKVSFSSNNNPLNYFNNNNQQQFHQMPHQALQEQNLNQYNNYQSPSQQEPFQPKSSTTHQTSSIPRAPQNMHYILNPFEDDDGMSMSQAVDLDY